MFKLICLMLMLGAAFLGGMYVGQQPDSPDVFTWAQQAYQTTVTTSEGISAAVDQVRSVVGPQVPQPAPVIEEPIARAPARRATR